MAELNPRDRLQPCLLDRLTDDQSDQTKEAREKFVFSPRQLRQSILRDLAWLLNSPSPTEDDGLLNFEHVPTSVLNYGIPDMTGTMASSVPASSLERGILKAIQQFEPRLDRHGLTVRLVSDSEAHSPNTVVLEIKGEMIATQVPEPLFIKTQVDLESGQFSLKDRPNG